MFHIYFTLKAFADFQVMFKKLSQKQQLRGLKAELRVQQFYRTKGKKLKSRAA